MSQTLDQIIDEVQKLAHKTSSETNSLIVSFLNQAVQLLIEESDYFFDWLEHNSSLTYSTGEYRKALPTGFLDFVDKKPVYDETNENFLEVKNWQDFQEDQIHVLPNTTAPSTSDYGDPSSCSVNKEYDSNNTIYLHYLYVDPPVDATTVLRLVYFKSPVLLNATTHASTVIQNMWGCPYTVISAIKSFAVYKLKEYKGTDEDVDRHKRDWEEQKQAVKTNSDKQYGYTNKLNIKVNRYGYA